MKATSKRSLLFVLAVAAGCDSSEPVAVESPAHTATGGGATSEDLGAGGHADIDAGGATPDDAGTGGGSGHVDPTVCVEGTRVVLGDEYTTIIVYNDPAHVHSACWHVKAESDIRFCEGAHPFADGTSVTTSGFYCPLDGWTYRCACTVDPLIGTVVRGVVTMWFYVEWSGSSLYCDGCSVVHNQ